MHTRALAPLFPYGWHAPTRNPGPIACPIACVLVLFRILTAPGAQQNERAPAIPPSARPRGASVSATCSPHGKSGGKAGLLRPCAQAGLGPSQQRLRRIGTRAAVGQAGARHPTQRHPLPSQDPFALNTYTHTYTHRIDIGLRVQTQWRCCPPPLASRRGKDLIRTRRRAGLHVGLSGGLPTRARAFRRCCRPSASLFVSVSTSKWPRRAVRAVRGGAAPTR